ncbi:hypothetical protein PWT90_07190 [Aphanocladium album]|nr:hypothetical protein PWT90_07190 [Aphanocladium album]
MPRFRDRLPWRRAKDGVPASSRSDSSCPAEPPNIAEQAHAGSQDAAQYAEAPEPELQQVPSAGEQEMAEGGLNFAEPVALTPAPSLWDRAYIKLKENKPALVTDYEKLLLKELTDGSTLLKKEQLSDIVTRGLERMSEQKAKYTILGQEYVVKDRVAQVSKLLINLKSFISDAIKVSPEASLAWAGVCVILPLFSNPSTADEAQSSGFDYVTSRMRLYVGFEELLWPAHTQLAPDTKEELESSVEDLYVKILTFQLTSVLRFYRGWLGQLGRDLVQFDDWKSMLEAVKKAETIVSDDFKRLRDVAVLKELEKMTTDAEAQCASLISLLSVAEMQLHIAKELLKEAQAARKLTEANQPALDIPAIYEARYDSAEVHSQARCLEGTRKSIQERITSWVNDETADNLFWLNGPAGIGKSTVSRTMAEVFASQHRLAASYFFSRSRQGRNELSLFFPTLSIQVAEHIPQYKSHLREALREVSSEALVNKSPPMQFELLFTKVFKQESLKELVIPPQLIIIDALDEFGQQDRIWELLKPVSELRADGSFRLCVLITSRNTIEIDEKFDELMDTPFQRLDLHQEYSEESRADIETYLSAMFKQLGSKATIGGLSPWPDAVDMEAVKGRGKTPRQQLKKWLLGSGEGVSQLAQTYLPVLQDAFQLTPEEQYSKHFGPDAVTGHRIISAVVLAGTPISAITLAGLLELELDVVLQWLHSLRAVFDVRDDVYSPVKPLHKSFSDFLLDTEVRSSEEFWVDCDKSHEFIALRCFWRMKNSGLKRDICGLEELGYFSAEVEETRVTVCIPSDLQYAVNFCFHHLNLSGRQRENFVCLEDFLKTQLLHWLEALSILRSVSTAITGMTELTASISPDNSPTERLAHDAYRFVLSHCSTIQTAPLQAYVSALVFSPPQSPVKQCYHAEQPGWVITLSDMASHWDLCLMTIEPVPKALGRGTRATLSSDGSKLAIVLRDVIQVYETERWSVIGELAIRFSLYLSCTFSEDGRRLAMTWQEGFHDTTEIWDWATGIRLSSFKGFVGDSVHLRFCASDQKLAYFDGSHLEFLDIATNQRLGGISFKRLFTAKEFEESGRRDIISSPGGIELAKIISGQSLYSVNSRGGNDTDEEDERDDSFPAPTADDRTTISFSSHGELMARTREDILQLISVQNGQNLATIAMGYFSEARLTSDLQFFDDDRRLAHVACDGQLRIWSVEPLSLTQTVRIYDNGPFQVLFLDNRKQMISYACSAGSVSVWDMSHLTMSQTASASPELVYEERNWPSLSRMVTVRLEAALTIWDTRSSLRLQMLHSQPSAQGQEEFNTIDMRFAGLAANQQRLVFGDWGKKVRVWDIGKKPCLRVLEAPTETLHFKAISPNGSFLVFQMNYVPFQDNGSIHILDIRGDVAGWPATEFSISDRPARDFVFSDDSSILATYTRTHIHIWKLSAEWKYIRQFYVGYYVESVALSPDNQCIAACLWMGPIKIWDVTSACDDPIAKVDEERRDYPSDYLAVSFSANAKFVYVWSAVPRNSGADPGFWNGDPHGSYSPDPTSRSPYELKRYRASDGKFELSHLLAASPTEARPREVEEDDGFLVQTAYGIQKCGASVPSLTYQGYGMSEDRTWILRGSTRVLFVPAAYRVKRPRIVDSVAILRHNTHILLLQLK